MRKSPGRLLSIRIIIIRYPSVGLRREKQNIDVAVIEDIKREKSQLYKI